MAATGAAQTAGVAMIVLRSYRLRKILPYVRWELLLCGLLSAAVVAADASGRAPFVALPFPPLGVLGTALAILLGFRSSTGYARWWEARTLWGNVVNNSRVLARQVVSAVANAQALGKSRPDLLQSYAREMVLRQIAFAHALRLHLRREADCEVLRPLLPAADLARVEAASNRPNVVLQIQGDRLKDGVRGEMIGQFDPISMEPNLSALGGWQAACERIKDTPMLSQYSYYTRLFVWLFLILLPSSLLSLLPAGPARLGAVPLALLIGFIYAITSKVGAVNDDPFEGRIHDVPMTALCTTIERDLREQLGDRDLPPPPQPVDGYLY